MAQPHTDDIPPVELTATCVNIRHKLMYVDERHARRGFVDTNSDTRVYWCARTQDLLGPDGRAVEPGACGSGQRSCFCGR
jgi:hypothetical protein